MCDLFCVLTTDAIVPFHDLSSTFSRVNEVVIEVIMDSTLKMSSSTCFIFILVLALQLVLAQSRLFSKI